MAETQFARPKTVREAIKILGNARGKAKVLAGGTYLLVQLRAGMVKPGLIVDLKGIPELTQIKREKNGFRIGAAVSGAKIGRAHV